MRDDVRDIAADYHQAAEIEHSRLERHPAVAMPANELALCHQNLIAQGLEDQVCLMQAGARDLNAVKEQGCDAALLMGPRYPLIQECDRKKALQEVHDRLRRGGSLFSAFISRLGIMGNLIKNVTAWIEDQAEVRSLLEQGQAVERGAQTGLRGYFAKVSELIPLHEALGFETLALAGVEPASAADDESYNRLQGTRRQLWLDLLYEISAEPSIAGASRHLLYTGRKK